MVLSPSVCVACSDKVEGPIPELWVGCRRDLGRWLFCAVAGAGCLIVVGPYCGATSVVRFLKCFYISSGVGEFLSKAD